MALAFSCTYPHVDTHTYLKIIKINVLKDEFKLLTDYFSGTEVVQGRRETGGNLDPLLYAVYTTSVFSH